MGDGRVDFHGLTGFFFLLLRLHVLQRTHIVQTIGQLDQDDTDIFCHGEEHLAQVLCLHLHLVLGPGQLSQLRDAVYQKRYLRTKLLRKLIQRHDGVFHDIMKNACRNGLLIHLKVCQNDGNTKRVNDIGFTRFSFLILVCLMGNLVRFLDQGDII